MRRRENDATAGLQKCSEPSQPLLRIVYVFDDCEPDDLFELISRRCGRKFGETTKSMPWKFLLCDRDRFLIPIHAEIVRRIDLVRELARAASDVEQLSFPEKR